MYGCGNNLNGCLSVSACKLGGEMAVYATKTTTDMTVVANKVGDRITISAKIFNDNVKISVKPIGKKVIVTCSLICTVNKSAYLNVVPDYVWLTPDMLSGEFDIVSNVHWNIV